MSIKINNVVVADFDSAYTKDNLQRGLFPFVNAFYKKERDFCLKNGLTEKLLDTLPTQKKAPAKSDLAAFCLPVFLIKEIFLKFSESLPLEIREVLQYLIWSGSISENEISKLIGKKPYTGVGDRWSYRKNLQVEFYFFSVKQLSIYNGSENDIFFELSLPVEIRKILKMYYPIPDNAIIHGVDEQKVKNSCEIFEGEAIALQDVGRLFAYYLQDNIKYSTRGKPNASTLNKMKKSLQIKEYYDGHKELGTLRSYLLAMATSDCSKKNVKANAVEQVKFFYDRYMSGKYPFAEFLLTDIKGFHNVYSEYLLTPQKEVVGMLKTIPVGMWVSIENLENFAKYNEYNFAPLNQQWALNNHLYFEEELKSAYSDYTYKEKSYVKASRLNILLSMPFFKGFLFTLSSIGALDIAYVEPNMEKFAHTYYSNYDGIQYIKLNALGAYLLGKTNEYVNQVETGGKLIFSEDSLIILAEGDISLYDVLLKNYAEKVSETRYRVTPQSFLKDCKSKKDLATKIDIFRQTISQKIPENWEEFIGSLVENNKTIKTINSIKVFKINENERNLQKIVAQDIILKELVIKAEKYHILVSDENYAKFKARLKDYGYLVE